MSLHCRHLYLNYTVFHILQFRKFVSNNFQLVLIESIDLKPGLTFQPQLFQIVDHDVKSLRNKNTHLMKVVSEGSLYGEVI